MTDKRMIWWVGVLAAILLVACGGQTAVDSPQVEEPSPADATADQSAAPAESAGDAGEEMEVSGEQGGDVTEMPDAPQTDVAFTSAPTAQGEVIYLLGRVLDVNGDPVSGAAVEIWQTDASGVYDHPNDPGTNGRDRGFQFYGTTLTDAEGDFVFRTIKPGVYEGRPPHIHFKVKMGGTTLLTSQFYFIENEAENSQDSIAVGAGDVSVLALDLSFDGGVRGTAVDVVVDTGIGSGSLALFPAQTEGPYYPVVTVADFDNDLASISE